MDTPINQSKCFVNKCQNNRESSYEFCKNCIREYIRICTCNKEFIKDKPSKFTFGKKNSVVEIIELPTPIPDYFYTHIQGNLYHILGCRGCQHIEPISIKNNFKDALQSSITSCIYQKNEEDANIYYEYLSDSIDPVFEEYAIKHGINLGEPAQIIQEID